MATLKGPYHFGASLGVRLLGSRKLVPSSHTLAPTSNGVNLGLSVTQESCAFLGQCSWLLRCVITVVLALVHWSFLSVDGSVEYTL